MWRLDLRSVFRRLVFSRFEARLFDEREAKNAKIRKTGSKMESLILAQDECWRRA